jgi:glutaredoxin
MAKLELYGTARCPYTQDLREWLEWNGREFLEYDVEADASALSRMRASTGQYSVPVLIEDGSVLHVGWQGRVCVVCPLPGGDQNT